MELGIKGKTALITASSKGIGKAIAEGLAAEGCNVAICSRTKTTLIETAREIKIKYGIEPFWGICDISQQKDIDNFFTAVQNQFGTINILVNNCDVKRLIVHDGEEPIIVDLDVIDGVCHRSLGEPARKHCLQVVLEIGRAHV